MWKLINTIYHINKGQKHIIVPTGARKVSQNVIHTHYKVFTNKT